MVAGLQCTHFSHGLCLEGVCGCVRNELHTEELSSDPMTNQKSVIDSVVGEVLDHLVLTDLAAKALRLVDESDTI